MAVPTRSSDPLSANGAPGNDVTQLYAHVGAATRSHHYRELVREEAARAAAGRWPLLAEVENLSARPNGQ
jgi:hypothetical protein